MSWYPFKELETLRREIDRTFEQFGLSGVGPRVAAGLANSPLFKGRGYPLLNLRDTPESLVAELLVPGIDPASLKVAVANNVLTVLGEKPEPKVEEENYLRGECDYGKFSRSFELPSPIDPDKIAAEYRHGVLTITMAKAEAARPRQIEVKVS